MSKVVMVDAQWTMAATLKPFPNFERVYQGEDGTRPIAFPGTLDVFAAAGLPGYDPNLIAGFTVPLGSRITIWIPQTIDGYTVNALYQYQILWRLRTVKDYRAGQGEGQVSAAQSFSSYHLPTSLLGQPERLTPPATTNERFFLPGATNTVAFEQTEPTGGLPGVTNLRGEVLRPVIDPVWVQPLTPQGNDAVWQQGTYLGSSHPNTGGPSWLQYVMDAMGDEMLILAYKIPPALGAPPPWDFTVADPGDLAFSNTYGNNNGQNPASPTGILVLTGTT